MRRVLLAVLLLFPMVLLVMLPQPAHACQCTAEEVLDYSDVVFKGTAIHGTLVERPGSYPVAKYYFLVKSVWKGGDLGLVETAYSSTGACAEGVHKWKDYIIYALYAEDGALFLYNPCGAWEPGGVPDMLEPGWTWNHPLWNALIVSTVTIGIFAYWGYRTDWWRKKGDSG